MNEKTFGALINMKIELLEYEIVFFDILFEHFLFYTIFMSRSCSYFNEQNDVSTNILA